MPVVNVNGIEICYDTFGEQASPSILLVSGLGSQMVRWSEDFCMLLVEKGFRVIRFDNRDAGCSTFIEIEVKSANELISMLQQGNILAGAYTLLDMVHDTVALLDHLAIEKVHVVGRSMGGIIAQLMTSEFPERIMSLTAVMSTTLDPSLPPTDPEVMQMMLRPANDFTREPEAFKVDRIAFSKRISGKYLFDENEEWALIQREQERAPAANILGQICAMALTGFDAVRLAKISVPTLVIHGTDDPIFPLACGENIAKHIQNARFLAIDGMGHAIPKALNEQIAAEIAGLTASAQ